MLYHAYSKIEAAQRGYNIYDLLLLGMQTGLEKRSFVNGELTGYCLPGNVYYLHSMKRYASSRGMSIFLQITWQLYFSPGHVCIILIASQS